MTRCIHQNIGFCCPSWSFNLRSICWSRSSSATIKMTYYNTSQRHHCNLRAKVEEGCPTCIDLLFRSNSTKNVSADYILYTTYIDLVLSCCVLLDLTVVDLHRLPPTSPPEIPSCWRRSRKWYHRIERTRLWWPWNITDITKNKG